MEYGQEKQREIPDTNRYLPDLQISLFFLSLVTDSTLNHARESYCRFFYWRRERDSVTGSRLLASPATPPRRSKRKALCVLRLRLSHLLFSVKIKSPNTFVSGDFIFMRRERDSNPWYPFEHAIFPRWYIRPLCHLSNKTSVARNNGFA